MPTEVIDAFAGLNVAESLCLGVSVLALFRLVLAFAEANAAYFDPRRADESERALPLLIAVGPAWFALRETARDAAALFILLTTRPKGAMAA